MFREICKGQLDLFCLNCRLFFLICFRIKETWSHVWKQIKQFFKMLVVLFSITRLLFSVIIVLWRSICPFSEFLLFCTFVIKQNLILDKDNPSQTVISLHMARPCVSYLSVKTWPVNGKGGHDGFQFKNFSSRSWELTVSISLAECVWKYKASHWSEHHFCLDSVLSGSGWSCVAETNYHNKPLFRPLSVK